MESNHAALRVGLFVLAGGIAVVAVIFFLSGSFLHRGTPYETYFQESVQGLDVGTTVKFRGVSIGKITDIGLVMAEYPPNRADLRTQKPYRQVVVRFAIDPRKLGQGVSVPQAVAHGLRVQIAPQGITGLAYLELTFVSPDRFPAQAPPWKPETPVIPSIPSTLSQVQDAVEQVLSAFAKVPINKMVDDLTRLADTLDQEVSTGYAHQALKNANTLLVNLDTQLEGADLPGTAAAARNLVDGPKTRQLLGSLDQTAQQLNRISQQLPALVAASQAAVNQASETTADLQSALQPVLANLQSTSASLNGLASELKSNPSQVLLGAQPPPEDQK